MMDRNTVDAVRALVIHHKEMVEEHDSAAGCAVTERVERALENADGGQMGTFRVTGLSMDSKDTAPGIYFNLVDGRAGFFDRIVELMKSGRVVTLFIEEGR